MSFSKGSVGLIYRSPRLKMPERIAEIPGLLPPVLTLIYNAAMIIKNTTLYIRASSSYMALASFNKIDSVFFPHFLSGVDCKNRKRKLLKEDYLYCFFFSFIQLLIYIFVFFLFQ